MRLPLSNTFTHRHHVVIALLLHLFLYVLHFCSQGFREVAKVKVDENACFGATKKSNVVPVVEQFKTFSVYEDNNHTQVQLQIGSKVLSNVADKENIKGVDQNL